MSRTESFRQGSLPGSSIVGQPLNVVNLSKPTDNLPAVEPNKRPEQLAMWKTAGEIKSEYEPLRGDKKWGETDKDLWERKAQEAKKGSSGNSRKKTSGETLAESIKKVGIKHPVSLQFKDVATTDKPTIFGGHHRIAAASEIDPKTLVPVEYSGDFWAADTNQRSNDGNTFPKGSGSSVPRPNKRAPRQPPLFRESGI